MDYYFDALIIGSGVSGTTLAYALNKKLNCAIIEEREWGGTCVLRGCDPKKVFTAAVEAKDFARRMRGKGIRSTPEISFSDLAHFKEQFVRDVPFEREQQFNKVGIHTFSGKATFIDSNQLQVNDDRLFAEYIIIASGAKPNMPKIDGQKYLQTSDAFLDLKSMPKSIVFIGGGYIAFELATIARAAGSNVHIIHRNSSPLKNFDADLVARLVNEMQNDGVHFHFDSDVESVSINRRGNTKFIVTTNQNSLEVDAVFATTGRTANVDKLCLEKIGVQYDKKGVYVDKHLKTSKNIFACGDAANTDGAPLTPVDSFEANYLAKEILTENNQTIQYPQIPSVVFTNPKLAQIGLSAQEALKTPDKYQVNEIDMTNWYTYKRTSERVAYAKIIVERKTNLVKGASFLSEEADHMINYFALLMKNQLTKADLENVIFAYPSLASDLTSLL